MRSQGLKYTLRLVFHSSISKPKRRCFQSIQKNGLGIEDGGSKPQVVLQDGANKGGFCGSHHQRQANTTSAQASKQKGLLEGYTS